MSTRRGQATAEFALIATILFGLLLGVIDLSRAGFAQHNLDDGASDLARSLATLSGTLVGGSPAPLDPANAYAGGKMQADISHAAAVAGGAFSSSALVATGAMTLTNGQVTVSATPNITAATELTVTVTAPFTPLVGLYLKGSVLHLKATSTEITPAGQQ